MYLLWFPLSLQSSDVSFQVANHGLSPVRPELNLQYRIDQTFLRIHTDHIQWLHSWSNDTSFSWVAVEGQGYRAHNTPTPWIAGAPATHRGFQTSYLGIATGQQRTGDRNLTIGGEAKVRYYRFRAGSETSMREDGAEFRLTVNSYGAFAFQHGSLQIVVGEDFVAAQQFELQPHIRLVSRYRPDWTIAPWVELYAGWGENQDEISLSRLGGLHPNVIPVAGTGWGEWWVEDYLSSRLGVSTSLPFDSIQLQLGSHVDAARFNKMDTTGFGQHLALTWKDWIFTAHFGVAPWTERRSDVSRFSNYIAISKNWPVREASSTGHLFTHVN